MKRLMYLTLVVLTLTACKKDQRYYASSNETNTLMSAINAYESQDWATWRSHFADTAKIYVNSANGMTIEERAEELNGMTGAMSSYGFNHDDEHIEMVVDNKDETWVYYWADHEGTFKETNKELVIPVHLAVRFSEGKIVAEHIYFDATEMNAEMQKLSASNNGNSNTGNSDEAAEKEVADSHSTNNATMANVEHPPIYPGCEEATGDERIKCLSDMINKFVDDNFDQGLAMDLGLTGKQRIFVNFEISANGNVENVKARAQHEGLVTEAERVVNLLPEMKPAEKMGQPVSVPYSLPILFKIEEM